MISGGSWWFLMALGCSFVVRGGSWWFLVVLGGSWQLLVVL